jgi:hypothetical protein
MIILTRVMLNIHAMVKYLTSIMMMHNSQIFRNNYAMLLTIGFLFKPKFYHQILHLHIPFLLGKSKLIIDQ